MDTQPVYNTRATVNTASDVDESGDDDVLMTPSASEDDDVPWHSSSRYETVVYVNGHSKIILLNRSLDSSDTRLTNVCVVSSVNVIKNFFRYLFWVNRFLFIF